MRFAWIREKTVGGDPVNTGGVSRLIYIAYNVLYWVPMILPFLGIIDYRTGFILLTVYLFFRFAANLYRNNALTPQQAETFPLRSP